MRRKSVSLAENKAGEAHELGIERGTLADILAAGGGAGRGQPDRA
jgi:hypothetical protein